MSIHLWPTAILIGNYDNAIDSTWYANDGIVNSISMSHPKGTKGVLFDGTPKTGIWQYQYLNNYDHQAVIGHHIAQSEQNTLFALYNKHCMMLYSLK